MSQVREPLPPGPEGPEQAPTENSSLISLPGEKSNQENTAVGDKDITQPSNNQNIQPEIQEQAVWGNHTDGDLVRRNVSPSTLEECSEVMLMMDCSGCQMGGICKLYG